MRKLPWTDNMLPGSTKKGKISIKESPSILAKFNLIMGEILPVFYEYNNIVKQKGFYLKPVHVVVRKLQDKGIVKYYYYGRYWYKIEKEPGGKIKWIYIGKNKPLPELPDPPKNPLEGVVVKVYNETVEIVFASEKLFKIIYDRLSSQG